MTDTQEHIKVLQQKIWLSKPPMERLRQMMVDNEALFQFWKVHKEKQVIPKSIAASEADSKR
jgi:hypothetical protein